MIDDERDEYLYPPVEEGPQDNSDIDAPGASVFTLETNAVRTDSDADDDDIPF